MSPKYKGMPVDLFGLPQIESKKTLKHKFAKRVYLHTFRREEKGKIKKKFLLIYDIPEGKKKERDWFRRQLLNLGYTMIQRSVWIGPSLPKDFQEYIKSIGLKNNFKILRLYPS